MDVINILNEISAADRLDFSQNLTIARDYLGDRLFPDQKTQNLKAEYLRLAAGANIPVMATVHALDTEAEIGSRPVFDLGRVEKLLIKRKINQTERLQLLLENGALGNEEVVKYVFDDMRLMAESVKTRTEVAKMEVLSTGKMTISENNLTLNVNYGVPSAHLGYTIDLSTPQKDALGQMMNIVDDAADAGYAITELVTSNKVIRKLTENEGIQRLLYGSVGVGTYAPMDRVRSLFGQVLGFSTITANDERYRTQRADGSYETKRYFPADGMSFVAVPAAGSFGVGLWGPTPEEQEYGQYSEKSAQQFITITQWATPDPVAVWTKASGMFIPVLPNPNGLYVAKAVLEPANP